MGNNSSKPAAKNSRVVLDPIERLMIALLQKDGRLGIHALARKLGVSDVTARRKLRRLLKDEIVQIVAAVDPFQVGFESPVIIGLKIDRSRIDEIAAALCEHPSIRYVAAATGSLDLLIEVVAASNHDLAEFVLGDLAAIPGIVDTETFLVLRIYKQTWNWGVRGVETRAAQEDDTGSRDGAAPKKASRRARE
ncbi:MAG TPA: Lrp/AsnC family transcriptional regulator [Candidatus Dormibacteraeota bacterium]|jgi:Lrp/AsnC family transcriptional regulator for asnA, asnC and gidA